MMMSNQRRLAVSLVLALAGVMTPCGTLQAGTIAGSIYEINGVTAINSTTDPITIEALDYALNSFISPVTQTTTSGSYSLLVTPTSTTNRSVYLKVTRGGQVVISALGPLRGNKS